MSGRLQIEKSGLESVRSVVRKSAQRAHERLADHWPVADEAIHDARKRLKKARAGLRLVRDALGKRAYRRENVALRDAARPLSALRDAKILVEAFDHLVERVSPAPRRAYAPLRDVLVTDQIKVRRRVLRNQDALSPVLESLRRTRKRTKEWRPGRRGWSVMGPGLRRVYRSGRAAFAMARSRPTVEHLHEWRKQVKYHWHHLEILEPIWPARMKERVERAHELSDRLGEDHDLAVLRQRTQRVRARLSPAVVRQILSLIDDRRHELQAEAMELGEKAYRERPRAFEQRLRAWQSAWRAGVSRATAKKALRAAARTPRRLVRGGARASASNGSAASLG